MEKKLEDNPHFNIAHLGLSEHQCLTQQLRTQIGVKILGIGHDCLV